MVSTFTFSRQETRLLRLTMPLGLLAECVREEEDIGKGYTPQIDAVSTNTDFELKLLPGHAAPLEPLTFTSLDAAPIP